MWAKKPKKRLDNLDSLFATGATCTAGRRWGVGEKFNQRTKEARPSRCRVETARVSGDKNEARRENLSRFSRISSDEMDAAWEGLKSLTPRSQTLAMHLTSLESADPLRAHQGPEDFQGGAGDGSLSVVIDPEDDDCALVFWSLDF